MFSELTLGHNHMTRAAIKMWKNNNICEVSDLTVLSDVYDTCVSICDTPLPSTASHRADTFLVDGSPPDAFRDWCVSGSRGDSAGI